MIPKARRQIAAVDLFCGVGGLTHGLERAGINVVVGVDLDPACRHAFESNNTAKFQNADVTKMSAAAIATIFTPKSVSLLAGCAPCQPFSTYSRSARRLTMRGRGHCASRGEWKPLRRFGQLIEECQPDLVTMENVPPLRDQPIFLEFLGCLSGYHVSHALIDGHKVGLPQTRKRLVLLASKHGPIAFPDIEASMTTVRETIEGLSPLSAGDTDPDDPLHAASRLSSRNLQRIRASKPGGTWRDWPEGLRARCHERRTGATYPSVYGRMEWDAPSPTITTQCFGYGNGRFGHPEQDRAISLREAAMLQGFPHDYSFLNRDERPVFATLGRLIGNAVPVPLGEYIGQAFVDHIATL